MRRAVLLTILMAVGGVSLTVSGYQQRQPPPIPTIERIRDNLYVITGADPNK